MDAIFTAILDDDRPRARELLNADPALAIRLIDEARLYESKIFHWIYSGDTALHHKHAGYRVEIVRLLLAAGVNPNSTANHRRSGPLHYAADGYITGPVWDATRQVKTIQCLLDAGADINAQDKNGATPLHRAVRTLAPASGEVPVESGSDATRKNKSGSTPFILAAQNTGRGRIRRGRGKSARREIVQEFLSFGLNPAIKDGNGKSVMDWAKNSWIRGY